MEYFYSKYTYLFLSHQPKRRHIQNFLSPHTHFPQSDHTLYNEGSHNHWRDPFRNLVVLPTCRGPSHHNTQRRNGYRSKCNQGVQLPIGNGTQDYDVNLINVIILNAFKAISIQDINKMKMCVFHRMINVVNISTSTLMVYR